jgi:hypothetical protein
MPPLSHLEALALLALDDSTRAGDARPRLRAGDSAIVRDALQARGFVDAPRDGWIHANLTPAGVEEVKRLRARAPWMWPTLSDDACRALHHLHRQDLANRNRQHTPRSRSGAVPFCLWDAMERAGLVTLPGPRSAMLTATGQRIADDIAPPLLADIYDAIASAAEQARVTAECPDPGAYWGTCD